MASAPRRRPARACREHHVRRDGHGTCAAAGTRRAAGTAIRRIDGRGVPSLRRTRRWPANAPVPEVRRRRACAAASKWFLLGSMGVAITQPQDAGVDPGAAPCDGAIGPIRRDSAAAGQTRRHAFLADSLSFRRRLFVSWCDARGAWNHACESEPGAPRGLFVRRRTDARATPGACCCRKGHHAPCRLRHSSEKAPANHVVRSALV